MARSRLTARTAFAALAAVACLAVGCAKVGGPLASASELVLPVRVPERAYETLFPHYAELCAVSRFERLGVERGGSAGHAVLYLKGACRDEAAPYPTLRVCPDVVNDPRDPRHGVGVSVNAAFANVNWVAYPGRQLFFNGNLRRGQVLDQAHFEATLRSIVDQGLLRGVEVHAERLAYLKTPRPPADHLAEGLIGTDVAIRFARSLWCARIPLERPQLERVIAHLNGLNRHYAESEASYQYRVYYDNCLRALHDSLAAAGVWAPRKVRSRPLLQVGQMGVPANEFVDLAVRANLFPLEDLRAVAGDAAMARSLRELDWLPARHGALLESAPVHRPNELYDTSLQMFVLEGPRNRNTNRARLMLADARFTDLEANLRWWEERYERILARPAERAWLPRRGVPAELRERYEAYAREQLTDVRALLARLPRD